MQYPGSAFWQDIDLVMLDMDGTLLDRYFDDYFWEQLVPREFAARNNLGLPEAQRELLSRYQTREGTLSWTDLDYWSRELGLDIPALKLQVDHLISVHPYVLPFLEFCRQQGKKIWLVTNAHSKTLKIKMAKTALNDHFDRLICAEEIGMAKEEPEFWIALGRRYSYRPQRAMLAEDNEKVLLAAAQCGIRHLVFVARPSSRQEARPSRKFPSIVYFKELMPPGSPG